MLDAALPASNTGIFATLDHLAWDSPMVDPVMLSANIASREGLLDSLKPDAAATDRLNELSSTWTVVARSSSRVLCINVV